MERNSTSNQMRAFRTARIHLAQNRKRKEEKQEETETIKTDEERKRQNGEKKDHEKIATNKIKIYSICCGF